MNYELEQHAREELVCLGCNGPKETGPIVCWDCFKRRQDGAGPFKYFGGSFSDWLRESRRWQ